MKSKLILALLAAVFVMGSYVPASAQDVEKSCEEWRCEFQARLDAECDCSAASNHGRYVSCVAHIVNDLVEEGLPTNCKGKLKRCAARSICGKQSRDFKTCTTVLAGDCDETSGYCLNNDTSKACLVDTDCDATQCRIRRGECDEGALVNVSPSCCSTCAVVVP